jgi:hypothetical protein
MVGRYMNDLEKIWKEAVVDDSRYYPRIGMGRRKKTTEDMLQSSWCPS